MKKKFQILKITIFLVFIIITTKLFFVQIINKNKYLKKTKEGEYGRTIQK